MTATYLLDVKPGLCRMMTPVQDRQDGTSKIGRVMPWKLRTGESPERKVLSHQCGRQHYKLSECVLC